MKDKFEVVVQVDSAMAESCPEIAAGFVMTRVLDQMIPADLYAQWRISQWLFQKITWDLRQMEEAERTQAARH